MLDIILRPLKDRVFNPLTGVIPASIKPLHLTMAAFICGLGACYCATVGRIGTSLLLWVLNRVLDCLDGAVARRRNKASDLGGFLDLLGDFIVYSLIPISCALAAQEEVRMISSAGWLAVAVLEASFHINNFVLFFIGAILEKSKAARKDKVVKELTSVAMRPALIEGTESAVIFTAMLAFPQYVRELSWLMAVLVSVGIAQRVIWVVQVLR